MTPIAKINLKVTFQELLLVVIVFLIGCYMRGNEMKAEREGALKAYATLTDVMDNTAAKEYPQYTFKSHEKWQKYINESLDENKGVMLEGVGKISKGEVRLSCFLQSNGHIFGRYENLSNKITLDVNGYLDPEDGSFHIRLGHKKEQSNMTLFPLKMEPEENRYVYKGTWGKKELPTEITFSLMNRGNSENGQ